VGLKPHIQVELELDDITYIEVATHEAKATEKSTKNMHWPKLESVYLRRQFPQVVNTDNTKYVPPLLPEGEKTNLEMKIMKEGTCKRCGKKMGP